MTHSPNIFKAERTSHNVCNTFHMWVTTEYFQVPKATITLLGMTKFTRLTVTSGKCTHPAKTSTAPLSHSTASQESTPRRCISGPSHTACRHPRSPMADTTTSIQAYRNITKHRRVPSLRRNRVLARNRRKAAQLSVSYAHYFADSCDPSSRGLTFRNKRLPGERPLDTDSMVYFLSHTRHFMKWRGVNRDVAGLFRKLAL